MTPLLIQTRSLQQKANNLLFKYDFMYLFGVCLAIMETRKASLFSFFFSQLVNDPVLLTSMLGWMLNSSYSLYYTWVEFNIKKSTPLNPFFPLTKNSPPTRKINKTAFPIKESSLMGNCYFLINFQLSTCSALPDWKMVCLFFKWLTNAFSSLSICSKISE